MTTSPYVTTRVQAIKDLGHIAWSGGPPIAKFAGSYLVNLMSIASDVSMPMSMRLAATQAIGNICSSSKDAKDRTSTMGMVEVLCEILQESGPEHSALRKNAVQSLLIVLCDNRENQTSAVQYKGLKETLSRISEEDWTAWSLNEAERLGSFLGFDREMN
ncbi:armadillo-like helical domain-containing protein 2 isoform X2 [Nematostella vectensis]|nr:armadillo-like helical domain-containing protein 2 isoform X2 [Nematostella vectensis]